METSLDLSRWREKPNGIAYRRWVIVSTGLQQVLRTRFFRAALFASWLTSLLVAAVVFSFSQAVASGGWLETWAAQLGPRPGAMAKAFGAVVLLYPDICIRGLYTSIFWLQSFAGLWLSLIVITALVPKLVTRDRASHALTIYLSRPLTSADYLLGKLGIIVGVLALFWTGPLLGGWFLSLLVAPSRDFFLYSLSPFGRALAFNAIGALALASIGLGVSALGKNSRNTVLLWIAVWILAGAVAQLPRTPQWVRRASFSHDLGELRRATFRLDQTLIDAVQSLPLIDRDLVRSLTRASQWAAPSDTRGAAAGLATLTVLSTVVFFRKLRPE